MKKFMIVMLIALSLTFLAGCSGDGTADDTKNNDDTGGDPQIESYGFEYEDVDIYVNMDAESLMEKLGEEQSYFEAPSCAFEGIDKIYSYGSFEIHTYPVEDKDYVSAIILIDDSVQTKEGVYIGDPKNKVIETYGEDYNDANGAVAYEKGDGKLQFIFQNDAVAAIEYIATESK
ncbi:hypothetical protein [Alkalibacter mobilis]|uniref:hypothetical protein n=1 Tax=Alkalibacter mobilis TaxID=2787712 RepID=UPI00189C78F1|nr:hypothetical protein [Alkalibacter mobilis]MBF7097031.1 hypothetical protein [Alkalibacter mobilis]